MDTVVPSTPDTYSSSDKSKQLKQNKFLTPKSGCFTSEQPVKLTPIEWGLKRRPSDRASRDSTPKIQGHRIFVPGSSSRKTAFEGDFGIRSDERTENKCFAEEIFQTKAKNAAYRSRDLAGEGAVTEKSLDKLLLDQAPVTPLNDKEKSISPPSSLTPFTIRSCRSLSTPEDFCESLSKQEDHSPDKVAGFVGSSSDETPEESTFNAFVPGSEKNLLAPKKPCKQPVACNRDEESGFFNLRFKPVEDSNLNVARRLSFDDYFEEEDEFHNRKLQVDDSLVMPQLSDLASGSMSSVKRALDLSYERSSQAQFNTNVSAFNSSYDATQGPSMEIDIPKEQNRVAARKSFEENVAFEISPASPVTPRVANASSDTSVCPGAPVKATSKRKVQVGALDSVRRKLEF